RSFGVGAERGVAAHEFVAFRRRRLFGQYLWIALTVQRPVHIDVLLERQCRIEHGLHALETVLFDCHADLPRVGGSLLYNSLADLCLTLAKQNVVRREVGMSEHVSRDEHVLGDTVAFGEIGTSGIAWKDHLEQAR